MSTLQRAALGCDRLVTAQSYGAKGRVPPYRRTAHARPRPRTGDVPAAYQRRTGDVPATYQRRGAGCGRGTRLRYTVPGGDARTRPHRRRPREVCFITILTLPAQTLRHDRLSARPSMPAQPARRAPS